MDEDEITQRLRDAGRQQVPGDVRAHHLSRMDAGVPVVERPKRFGRVAVAAAAIVGFTVGSTGFAMAGALPAPAQGVAHDVLSVVQVEVPDRPHNHGECVSELMKTMDPATPEAARKHAKDEACPKDKGKPEGVGHGRPDHAGQGRGRPAHAGTPGGPKADEHEGDPCTGRPPWAGKKSAEEKQALKAQRPPCRDLDEDELDEDELEDDELEETETDARQGGAEGRDDEAPGAEQRQADPGSDAPAETPPGPPAQGAPGQLDDTAPPVDVPSPDQPTNDAG